MRQTARIRRREFLIKGLQSGAGGALLLSGAEWAMASAQEAPARQRTILVWSEGTAPKEVYPNDIRGAVAAELAKLRGYTVKTATLSDPEQGISQAALDATDVLIWWGHLKHGDVSDTGVERIVKRVREGGMGIIFLHSAHFAKPLKAVLGASGAWKDYVNDRSPHRITVADPKHPIARGVRDFVIPQEERYEEPFIVPTPEAVVFEGYYEKTKTKARQGLCWTIGKGRVFYFRPGHEEFPVFFMPEVRRIMRNAALWAARDEAGIWEDNDPAAPAARATREPPLALILRDAGYAGTDVTAVGEIEGQRYVKAGPGPVKFIPLAAYGVPQICHGGWYNAGEMDKKPSRTELWKIDAPNNKRMAPPLMPGGKTEFDPGDKLFGLWVATEGFPGEVIYTEDALQAFIKRFPTNNRHKAHVYAAVRSDYTPVPNAVFIGFEYSTNDDNQEVVALVENVRPFRPEEKPDASR
jgi:trehalose utilization protein